VISIYMLVNVGARRETPDVVGALQQCHDRIRSFVALAAKLAAAPDAPPDEVRDAAARIVKYFTEALPFHVADEDETIAPRLAGASAEVDAALATLAADHHRHEPLVAELVAIARAIAADPAALPARAADLARAGAALAADFDTHLALEERVLHPAIAALPAADQDAIRAAMKARRDRAC
jgi:iron-sulfur cluster repair protein YtfE (RIC family)